MVNRHGAPFADGAGRPADRQPRHARLGAAALVVVLALVGTVLTVAPASALTTGELADEVDYVRRINQIRKAHGLRPVVEDVDLNRKAREWSGYMANGRCGMIPLCHDPNLAGGISSPWSKLGENVAYGQLGGNARVMDGLMGSPLHKQNILDPSFTRIGIGVIHRNGLQHVTQKFMAVPGEVIATNAPNTQRYVDVRYDHPFYANIEWLAVRAITFGDSKRMFRASGAVSRQEMAAFLYRLAGSPGGTFPNPGFRDVGPGHPFYREIAWMVHAGVGKGYADGTFRPGNKVDRAAAAAYLYGLAGSPGGTFPNPGFRDVRPSHLFYRQIAWFAASGVGNGYPDGTYRPGAAVSRGEMAAFLHRYATR